MQHNTIRSYPLQMFARQPRLCHCCFVAVQVSNAAVYLGFFPHLLAYALRLFYAALQGRPDSRAVQGQVHQRPQDVHPLLKAQIIVVMSLELLQPALPMNNFALCRDISKLLHFASSELWT